MQSIIPAPDDVILYDAGEPISAAFAWLGAHKMQDDSLWAKEAKVCIVASIVAGQSVVFAAKVAEYIDRLSGRTDEGYNQATFLKECAHYVANTR